jgi:hypothetical protein
LRILSRGCDSSEANCTSNADYIRGRRIKTSIAVRANGTVKLETIGRGKAVLRWLDRLQGKKLLQSVGE